MKLYVKLLVAIAIISALALTIASFAPDQPVETKGVNSTWRVVHIPTKDRPVGGSSKPDKSPLHHEVLTTYPMDDFLNGNFNTKAMLGIE